MGTSRNDRSPSTPSWKPALAAIGRPEVSPERQNREIWLAAAAERGEKLIKEFAHPSLAEACAYVAQGMPVEDALQRFDTATLHEYEAGLAIDMGRRALARAAAARGAARDFASELFAEAVSYYASRDLPSFVAAKNRIKTTSQSIELKSALRDITKNLVRSVGDPPATRRGWLRYVERVLSVLQGEG